MLCSQCGAAATRCDRCSGALCARSLCADLHEASCAAVSVLPVAPAVAHAAVTYRPRPRRERNPEAERLHLRVWIQHGFLLSTASRKFRVLHRLNVILSLRRIRDPSA